MLLPAPPLYPRTRKPRGKEKPAVPSGPPLTVLDVTTDDPPTAGQARWRFSGTVSLTAPVVTGLAVFIDGAWRNPIAAYQLLDPDAIQCVYDTGETLDGKAFQIVTTPAGFAEGARVVLPQSGTVAAP